MSEGNYLTEGSSAFEINAEPNNQRLVKVTPEAQAEAVTKEAQVLLAKPFLTFIKSHPDYERNAAHIVDLKAKWKELEEKRTSITGPINASLKAINDLFRGPAEMIKNAIDACELPMKGYIRDQDRIQREAEAARLVTAAKELHLQEESRQAAEAEVQNAREKESEATCAAQAETNPFLTATRLAQAAAASIAASSASEVAKNTIREQRRAESALLTIPIPQVRAAGTKINRPYKWQYTDKRLIPMEYMLPNEQLIGATVRTLKGNTNIPGIRVFQDISIGGR